MKMTLNRFLEILQFQDDYTDQEIAGAAREFLLEWEGVKNESER